MRGRELSVELQLDSGEVLPEVERNGTVYVVAQAGKPFKIVVGLLNQSSHSAANVFSPRRHVFCRACLRPVAASQIYLTVDGVGIGYSHVLKSPGQTSTAFSGTLVKCKWSSCTNPLVA
jgi:hypothetical protein